VMGRSRKALSRTGQGKPGFSPEVAKAVRLVLIDASLICTLPEIHAIQEAEICFDTLYGEGEYVMAKVANLKELYLDELEDLYDAEKRIVKALPKVAEAASDPELRSALMHHLEQTKGHISRLERVFQGLGQSAKSKTCDGMKGILNEGEDTIDDIDDPAVRDAGIIAAAQRVEHYEIAAYGTVRNWAEQLNDTQGARMLEETLQEEKEADRKLTGIAVNGANPRAEGVSPAAI